MPSWREAHFDIKSAKKIGSTVYRAFLNRPVLFRREGLRPCAIFKRDGRPGRFQENPERCTSPDMRSTRDVFIRDSMMLEDPGADFLRGLEFWP